ncbi:MAG: hypothetical protein II077_14760 [Treponema sp.]|nr:hypothetical protein [Treponema sp.]
MKVTPPLFLRIFKFCLTAGLLLFMQSCSHQEDDGSVCLNIPSSVCQRLAARDIGDPTDTMTIFVTGDYEAKKTISFPADNFPAAGIKVEFGGIRAGSKVRVVCLQNLGDDYAPASCTIGVSDEVTILGGQENAANVQLSNLTFYTPTINNIMSLSRNLPGCTYKWYFKTTEELGYCSSEDKREVTLTTSTNVCDFTGYVLGTSGFGYMSSTHLCTIYCNGTKIITLKPVID